MALQDPNLADYSFQGVVPYLFGRSWAVSLGTPGQSGKKYTQLRTTFDIMRTSESTSNKAKVELYNLTSDSRSQALKGGQLTLAAGYNNQLETLFVGGFVRAVSARHGPDIVTAFECGDGEQELYENFVNTSYPAGTGFIQVFQDLVGELGLSLGVVSGIQNTIFNKGFVAAGGVKDILDRELRKQGLEWSVQNGVVQVIPIGSHNGDTAVLISQDTGMIGVPNKGSVGGDDIVTFTSLLNPKLAPGVPVLLQSTTTDIGSQNAATGLFEALLKVRTAHFEGDSHESKWQVTCECEPLSQINPPQNQNIGGRIIG